MTDLGTKIGSVTLPNPVMTAAGTGGHGAELGAFFDLSELGAVVVKSLSASPWPGNPAPRLCPVPGGMLNAVGLQGPGIDAWADHDLAALARSRARVVVSIWGRTLEDYGEAARALARAVGRHPGTVVACEVNISCPNLEDRSRMFAHSAESAAAAVAVARGCGLPLWAKLSPNTPDIVEIAGAVLSAGAEALTLVNTLLGLAIDESSRQVVLAAGGGGLSGPAVHSVALRAVFDCATAFPRAPIVGVGGISDGAGALRMLLAGACALQVGTATLADPRAPRRVLDELGRLLEESGTACLTEVIGAARGRSQ
ncbi:MAG: dihydroorotate dehydrogenase [Acidimicrobiales bacterium]